jgi:hypothetical protein
MSTESWMSVSLSVEEHLRIECWARSLSSHPDKQKVTELCSSIITQLMYKDKLLKQAVRHIADLEFTQLIS